MPDDTPDYRHGLDDPDDDVPEFLRPDGSGKLRAKGEVKQAAPGKNPQPGPSSASQKSEPASKTDNRVYVWMGEEDIAGEEEPEEEHEIEPEFSPGKGQFDLSGNPLGKDDSWQPEGSRISRIDHDAVRGLDQFDLAGNPIAIPTPAEPVVDLEPHEVTFTPPPDAYVWEGDMDIEEEVKAKPESSKKGRAKTPKPKIIPVGKEGPVQLGVGVPGVAAPARRAGRQPGAGRKPAGADRRGKREARPRPKASKGQAIGMVITVLLLSGVVALFLLKAPHSDIVPYPSAIAKFTSTDKVFIGFRPSEWTNTPASVAGYQGTGFAFTSGATQMVITDHSAVQGSTLGSLVIDDEKIVAKKYPGYTEKPGSTLATPGGTGQEQISEWSTPGNFFHEAMHGYRMTMLDSGHAILMVCATPEQNWKILKPAFVSFINRVDLNQ